MPIIIGITFEAVRNIEAPREASTSHQASRGGGTLTRPTKKKKRRILMYTGGFQLSAELFIEVRIRKGQPLQ